MNRPPRAFTRSEAIEILAGLALMLGALAWWSPAVAAFAAGAVLFTFTLLGRRAT